MPHTVQTLPALDEHRARGERIVVTDPDDVDRVAQDLATGAVVGQAFANVVKGRPPGQVGSITTAPSRIPDVWD
jgi:hypothetical protein